jgi:hypothetical protein
MLPELIVPDRVRHLETFAGPGPEGFVFVEVKGGQLRRSNFSNPWARALVKAGLPTDTHVHDLRHTGNTLSAEAGASLPELMSRMDHSSARAAMVLFARQRRARSAARHTPGPHGPAGAATVWRQARCQTIGRAAGTPGHAAARRRVRRSCQRRCLTWRLSEWSG